MKAHVATATVVIDKKRIKEDETYPLKLRITYNRERRYHSIGLPSITEPDFEKLSNSTKLRDPLLKELKIHIEAIQTKAREVIDEVQPFSFSKFDKFFFQQTVKMSNDVFEMLEAQVKQFKDKGGVSTSTLYNCTLNSLKSYKKKLKIEDVTPKFLSDYESYMLAKNTSPTTISMYLRCLRKVFNEAIDAGIISRESYPFKKSKFQIPAGRNIKKALTKAEIKQIFEYATIPTTTEAKAKDFWIFSYLCNGMNIKDICRLKWSNIDGDKLTFIRAKTENTKKSNTKPINVHLSPQATAIIERWEIPRLPNSYVFDILPTNVTPQRERELVQYFTKLVNKYMKRIATELGINKPVTTYAARHSFSTILKRGGASIEFISESLGHQSLKTTESYLDSFDDDTRKEYANLLTDF